MLEPKYLGPNYQQHIHTKLLAEVDGKCNGRFGFIIAVTDLKSVGRGKVQEGTGSVVFPVKFTAIVFRPFKDEIVDGVVSTVLNVRFFINSNIRWDFLHKWVLFEFSYRITYLTYFWV